MTSLGAGSEHAPYRIEVSWREWYYEGGAPPDLRVGDSLPMREDRITKPDIEALADAYAADHGVATDDECRAWAAQTLPLILGGPS